MKKAAEIINITIEDGIATISYASGATRRYPEDKLPKTVTAWMEVNQEAPAEEPTYKEAAPEVITVATIQEPAQLPAVIEVTSAGLQTNFNNEVEADEEPAEEAPEASRLDRATEIAKAAASMAATAIRTAAPVATKAIAWTAGKLVDLYYWLTTYCPIAARWLAIHLAWFIQDAIPVITGAARVAGRGIVQGAATVAGWGLVAGLTAISVSIKAAKILAEGWKLREEIIQEQKAA